MCQVTRFLTLVAITILSSCTILAVRQADRNRCDILRKCSNTPDFAWATDGRNCAVFQNDCQLQNHNCERLRNNEKALKPVSREVCIKYCPSECIDIWSPICTIHNGKSETVSNDCFWAQKLCESGQAYVYQFKGACTA